MMRSALEHCLCLCLLAAVCAQDTEIAAEFPDGATMDMVWIEPGTFVMGSPDEEPGREPNEGPLHEVRITRGFYLGKTELTQGWDATRRMP